MSESRTSFEKLRGRENFDTWKVAVKSYLIIKKLWQVIDENIPPEVSPNTNAQAISELTLSIENSLYNYIEDSKSASTVWNGLLKAFDDSGVARKVTILNQLVSVKLTQYKSMEKYINAILLYWNKTKVAGFKIEEQVIASLMLGGLPEEYRAMILGIENSGNELTVDYVKNVLLQGIPDPFGENDDRAMPFIEMRPGKARKGYKGKRRCFKCGDTLHIVNNCPKKDLKCSECGDIRHLVVKCPRKKKKKSQPERGQPGKQEKTMVAFLSNCQLVIKDEWFIDSGATAHMCNDKSKFTDLIEGRSEREILVADNSRVKVHGTGTVKLNIGDQTVILKKVNYVPDMCANLISVRRITESGHEVIFTQGRVRVIGANKETIIEGRLLDGMYRVKVKNAIERAYMVMHTGEMWHRKLGHPGYARMKFVQNIDEKFRTPEDKCETCIMGKQTRASYKSKDRSSTKEPLELIHSDVNGPMPTVSIGGHRYFVSFIDDYSKKVFLYPMKLKSEVYEKLLEFKKLGGESTGAKNKGL